MDASRRRRESYRMWIERKEGKEMMEEGQECEADDARDSPEKTTTNANPS